MSSSASGGASPACASQFTKPSPSQIQSTGTSTGVAIELRKSSPERIPDKDRRWTAFSMSSLSGPAVTAAGLFMIIFDK